MHNLTFPFRSLLFIQIFLLYSALSYSQTFFPIDSTDNGVFEVFPSGGAVIQNFECTDANPCYWFNTGGQSVTIEFLSPQDQPSVRVWGMNDDDIGSMLVNEIGYDLSASTAEYSDKVICSDVWGSPGSEGILFQSGGIIGANTNSEGNWSYQDITLWTDDVESITVTSLGGAGWGCSGVTVGTISDLTERSSLDEIAVYPNPVLDRMFIDLDILDPVKVNIYDSQGRLQLRNVLLDDLNSIDLSILDGGIYLVELQYAELRATRYIMKL